MLDVITDNLDIWTTAQKQKKAVGRGRAKKEQGYGIKKLRELILELAVRGKLVPQDPNDEPASVLLEKIAEEKQRLIDAGKIKKQKVLPEIGEDEKPFELPIGWEWDRLGVVGIVGSSRRVHKKEWTKSGVPFYRAREIVKLSRFKFVDNELFISEELFQSLSGKGFVPETEDIMITGVGTIGTPYVVKESDKFYFKDASVLIFKNYFNLFPDYLELFLKSPLWLITIHKESMGTTVHTLTISRANKVLLALPPLAEQHRIVTKVDELMALCDQLEQEQTDHQATHQTLVKTLLNGLIETATHRSIDPSTSSELTAQDEQASTQHPVHPESTEAKPPEAQTTADYFNQFIAQHFDTLFTTEDSIDQLKQTILQLAVMGKLVPQNPKDEPASVLLEKIAQEKAKLIKEGKIKKQKALPEITEDEKPFGLPEGWEWAALGELSSNIHYGYTASAQPEAQGIRLLRITDIQDDKVDWGNVPGCEISDVKAEGYLLEDDDILIARTGGTIGKSYLVENM